MLLPVCCISGDWEKLLDLRPWKDEYVPCFLFSNEHTSANKLLGWLYSDKVMNLDDFRFTVCFDLASSHNTSPNYLQEEKEAAGSLCQILFHPHFFRENNNPVIVVKTADNRRGSTAAMNTIQRLLESQGLSPLRIVTLYTQADCTAGIWAYPGSENYLMKARGLYTPHLLNNRCDSLFLVYARTIEKLDEALQALEEADNAFAGTQSQYYQLMASLRKMVSENNKLHSRLMCASETLKNYKTYLQIIHDQDEANKINKFYHYEYEILPLWYKRFGHIIKVMMGRRTLRSLFDDTVKKYTD